MSYPHHTGCTHTRLGAHTYLHFRFVYLRYTLYYHCRFCIYMTVDTIASTSGLPRPLYYAITRLRVPVLTLLPLRPSYLLRTDSRCWFCPTPHFPTNIPSCLLLRATTHAHTHTLFHPACAVIRLFLLLHRILHSDTPAARTHTDAMPGRSYIYTTPCTGPLPL